jgi:hypothetical protein
MEKTRDIKATLSSIILVIIFLTLALGLYWLTYDLVIVAQALTLAYLMMAACLTVFLTLSNTRGSQVQTRDSDQTAAFWLALVGIAIPVMASFVYLGIFSHPLMFLGIASFFLNPWLGRESNLNHQVIASSISLFSMMILALFLNGLELITVSFVLYQSLLSGLSFYTHGQTQIT